MNRKISTVVFPKKEMPIKCSPEEQTRFPPWLFQNQDLINAFESADTIDENTLKNTLNHIHFTDGYVYVHLRHPKFEESILLRAHPEPCLETEITCQWIDENLSDLDLGAYQPIHLFIDDGKSMILVPAVLQEMDRNRLTIQIPQTSYAVGKRRARRYPCAQIDVELIQSGFLARGKLLDFSPCGFRIKVRPDTSCSFQWFNSDELATIHLRNDQQILFSGPCRFVRQQDNQIYREIVLTPVKEKISRYKKKQPRNPRQHLVPPPIIIFDHPFIKKRVELEVLDISTSGFSVCENADEGVLMPGMMIPELIIGFSGASRMKCTVQVIYRQNEMEKYIRCALAILDMDMNIYSYLTDVLTKALDPHAYISNEIDTDALWEFFFESGFIYPTKYRLIKSHRESFKETYKRLYQENPQIARHVTYQKNGRILGHLSMVRAYERTWMIHHHAARNRDSQMAGFMVLKQLMHFLNDIHRLPSAKIAYFMSYFRPDSKFPDRVFGGFARDLNNVQGCSLDLFSYLPYPTYSIGTRLPEGWLLRECSILDMWELNRFYKHHSGGLLLDILRLKDGNSSNESVENFYKTFGFMRKWKAYSLTNNRELNAVLLVDQSDFGLNLSELLNSIKIIVTKPEGLQWDILSIALGQLAPLYDRTKVPVLIYPFEYVDTKGIPYEKQYRLWILDVRYGNEFMEFMQRKFRIGYR